LATRRPHKRYLHRIGTGPREAEQAIKTRVDPERYRLGGRINEQSISHKIADYENPYLVRAKSISFDLAFLPRECSEDVLGLSIVNHSTYIAAPIRAAPGQAGPSRHTKKAIPVKANLQCWRMLLTRMQLTDPASKENTEFSGYAGHVPSSDSDTISELERRVNRRPTSLGVLR
jgi:hypothetical protein